MFRKKTSLALALAVAGSSAAPAQAALKKWARPTSGIFASDEQWSPGRPYRPDTALFDLSSAYSVRLAGNQTHSRLVVGDDKLVLRLHGSRYALTSTRQDALVVGRRSGDISRLTVRDGLLLTPRGVVGSASGARASLTLDNALWNTRKSLVVGNAGAATMTAISRSRINSTSAFLGVKEGSRGNVTLSGRGTIWNISDTLTVAPQGAGLITVRPGALLNVRNKLDLRDSGRIRLQGGSLIAGSLLAGGRMDLDAGLLNVTDGSISAGSSLVVNGGDVRFGALSVHGKLAMNNALARLDADRLLNEGQITGSGAIEGDIVNRSEVRLRTGQQLTFSGRFANQGSVLAERGSSLVFDGDVVSPLGLGGGGRFVFGGRFGTGALPSSLDIDGDMEFTEAGSLMLDIGADGRHDLLNITGAALLDDVVIRLDPDYDGPEVFVPLINAAKLTYGGSVTVDAPGRNFELVRTGQTLGVMLSSPVFEPPIPEPSTLSLVAVGAALGLLRRRPRF